MKYSLKDFIMDGLKRPPRWKLGPSQAGRDCIREIYYMATPGTYGTPNGPKALVRMAMGSAFDEYSMKSRGNGRAQVPVVFNVGSVEVRGSADLVFYGDDGEPEHVADLKTVSERTWAKVQNRPKPDHVAQVNLYAFGLGAPEWSILYTRASQDWEENEGPPEMKEHYGTLDIFKALCDFGKFEEASYWMYIRKEPPPRPYGDFYEDDGTVNRAVDRRPCCWCSYNNLCWEIEKK